MKEIILCKYGEIVLKGANRASFEQLLVKDLRYRAAQCGRFTVRRSQSLIYIIPEDNDADIDAMFDAAAHTCGIIARSRAAACQKSVASL